MSPRARTTAPKRSGSSTRKSTSSAKRGKGHTALDRLTKSVDAAQDALKDLRGEMGRSSSGVLKDIDKHLKDARKSLRSTSKSVIKDLEGLQQRITPGSGAKKSTSTSRRSSSGTARKTSARSSSARKSTTSPRARTTAPRARGKKS